MTQTSRTWNEVCCVWNQRSLELVHCHWSDLYLTTFDNKRQVSRDARTRSLARSTTCTCSHRLSYLPFGNEQLDKDKRRFPSLTGKRYKEMSKSSVSNVFTRLECIIHIRGWFDVNAIVSLDCHIRSDCATFLFSTNLTLFSNPLRKKREKRLLNKMLRSVIHLFGWLQPSCYKRKPFPAAGDIRATVNVFRWRLKDSRLLFLPQSKYFSLLFKVESINDLCFDKSLFSMPFNWKWINDVNLPEMFRFPPAT